MDIFSPEEKRYNVTCVNAPNQGKYSYHIYYASNDQPSYIIGGDFNCVLNHKLENNEKNTFYGKVRNK